MLPSPTPEEEVNSWVQVIRNLNRFGLPSLLDVTSIIGYPQSHKPLQTLVSENRLNIRLPFVDIGWDQNSNESFVNTLINRTTKIAPVSPGQNLHPSMEHGYEFRGMDEAIRPEIHDHENFDKPAYIIPKEQIMKYAEKDVRMLIEKRIPFRMHVTYNENLTPFLYALEKVIQTTLLDGMRWGIKHAETITPENIERVKTWRRIALDNKMAIHGDAFVKPTAYRKTDIDPD